MSSKALAAKPREKNGHAQGQPARGPAVRGQLHMQDGERFLRALGRKFSFQTFDDDSERKSKRLARVLHGTLAELSANLAELNAQGAGIFVMVNEGDGNGRSNVNVTRGRAYFADFDGTEPPNVASVPLAPHIVVESSPGRWHWYWLVDDAPLDTFASVQRSLAARFGSDPSVTDLCRVMRLPGFLHQKGEPFCTRIETLRDAPRYTYAAFREAFGIDSVAALLPAKDKAPREPPPGVDPARAGARALVYLQSRETVYEGGRNDAALKTSAQLKDMGLHIDRALEMMLEHWKCEPMLDIDELQRCIVQGYKTKNAAGCEAPEAAFTPVVPDEGAPASFTSDLANAYRLRRHLSDRLLYVHGTGWHVWTGTRWKYDPLAARGIAQGRLGNIVMDEVSAHAQRSSYAKDDTQRDKARGVSKQLLRHAEQVESIAKVEAALKSAENLMRAEAGDMDADPMLLGCENGVLDLRTGALLPADPKQRVSMTTRVRYNPEATYPAWEQFLARIFRAHREELIPFLRRLCGYWLTGKTDPAMLAVLYGSGANGKSTFVSAIQNVLGDYAIAAPQRMLVVRQGEPHTSELAALQGRRFVIASESDESDKLDEERVKLLTGGDTISARRLYQEQFQFQPTHKIVLQTNHKPVVHGTDTGIWRRLKLIPFEETIPEQQQDPDMADKLRAEAPGILRWAVQGCIEFQRAGLQPPPVVTDATQTYRDESDILAEFIDEECVRDPGAVTATSELYARYESWARLAHLRPMSKVTFGRSMEDRGFRPKKHKHQRAVEGVKLRGAFP